MSDRYCYNCRYQNDNRTNSCSSWYKECMSSGNMRYWEEEEKKKDTDVSGRIWVDDGGTR